MFDIFPLWQLATECSFRTKQVIFPSGSGRLTTRNRKFLRRFNPVMETQHERVNAPDFIGTVPPRSNEQLASPQESLPWPLSPPAPSSRLFGSSPAPQRMEPTPPPTAAIQPLSPNTCGYYTTPSAVVQPASPSRSQCAQPMSSTAAIDPPPLPQMPDPVTILPVAVAPATPRRPQRLSRPPKVYVPETGKWL